MGRSEGGGAGREEARADETGIARSDLQMSPRAMLELAHKAAELAVARIESLPDENAWDGEFKEGLERADSIGLDPHKWLFQPYEVGCLLVKDASKLEDVFAFGTTVLQDTIWGANHPNINDRGLQLSRSFRALKIWMSIQTFGMSAFRRAVSKGMELAGRAEEYIQESSVLELLTSASLGVVCMRVNPEGASLKEESLEEINKEVLARLFWDDRAFVSSTSLHGTFSLRLCIINHTTSWNDVRETLEAMERFGGDALAG